jgi:DNA-binding PadR family transcriptional regulator
MYKGHLRLLVLNALSKESLNGYKLMAVLAENIGKKPSSGSIYPLLELLHKEGLVSVKTLKRSKIYSLTNKGQTTVKEHAKHSECHTKFNQTMKMFHSMMSSKELAMAKEALEILMSDKKKAMTFKNEMLPLKMELIRLIKNYDKANVTPAKKILIEATNKLKKLQ